MKLTYAIKQEFTVELDGEELRNDYYVCRQLYPDFSDTEVLEEIYNSYMGLDILGAIDLGVAEYDLPNKLHATLNLTKDQFISLAREELGLGEDLADGLHGMFDFAQVPPENH